MWGYWERRLRCGLLVFGVIQLGGISPAWADEAKPPKRARVNQPSQVRIQRLEARVRELEQARKSTGENGRYQLQSVGDRAVVLDTQTGETRVIEPTAGAGPQSVSIGKAWVVVTVQVQAGDRPWKRMRQATAENVQKTP